MKVWVHWKTSQILTEEPIFCNCSDLCPGWIEYELVKKKGAKDNSSQTDETTNFSWLKNRFNKAR